MRLCEFCATELPDETIFCWHCGRAPTHSTEALTSATRSPAFDISIEDVVTAANIPTPSLSVRTGDGGEHEDENTTASTSENPALPQALPTQDDPASIGSDRDEEEEEEKQRHTALFGLGLPLATQAPGGDVPMVQGTPQINGVLSVQGTPSIPQIPHMPNVPKWQISRLPTYPNIPAIQQAAPAQHSIPLAQTMQPPQPTQPPPGSAKPKPNSGGCIRILLVAGVASVLIATSIIGAGLTILKPVLALSGSTNVVWGEAIHLHGSNFIPGSSVILTLDGTEALYYASHDPAMRLTHNTMTSAGMEIIEEQFGQSSAIKNRVVVAANGTFNVIVTVNPRWHIGQHIIRASEQISQRSAELSFTIHQPGETPTAIPTPFPIDTPTPTPLVLGLSCVKPASLTLTVDAGYTLPVSQAVTLCAMGSGTLNWTASWDHNAAPWLQLDHSSGQIQAPGRGQVTVSMLATGLKPGNYTTTVTFSSQAVSSPLALKVTFTVQSGCISVTPGAFKLTGATGNNSVQTQIVTVSNCGNAVGTWFASTSANWLKITPTSGILSGGTAQKVTIAVSQGQAGTYNGLAIFRLGLSQFTVQVTLVVQAPTLSVKPGQLQANHDCSPGGYKHARVWICVVTVTNLGDVSSSLDWSASSSGVAGITFIPSNGTLAAGESTQVEVDVPYTNSCPANATLAFSGPANSAYVAWSYTCN